MCMFYNKPKVKFFDKSRIAFKVMRKSGGFPYQTHKRIKRGIWMTAKAPRGEQLSYYGFHAFLDKADAFNYLQSRMWPIKSYIVIQVRVKGHVFGVGANVKREGKSGIRIEQLRIPKILMPLKQPKPNPNL